MHIKMKDCPFYMIKKEADHECYIYNDDKSGCKQVACTCGAKGPLMATEESAVDAWNMMDTL